jgi:hypothetical protein
LTYPFVNAEIDSCFAKWLIENIPKHNKAPFPAFDIPICKCLIDSCFAK